MEEEDEPVNKHTLDEKEEKNLLLKYDTEKEAFHFQDHFVIKTEKKT